MKRVSKNYNSILIEALCEKPIAFNPLLAKLADSALAGLFLSQFLYWHGKGVDKDWTYKTIKNVQTETSMTRSEQNRAICIWKQLGVLEVELRGLPRRRHFKINISILIALLEKTYGKRVRLNTNQFVESDKQVDKYYQNNTESTQEKTFRDPFLQKGRIKSVDFIAARKDLIKKFSFDL